MSRDPHSIDTLQPAASVEHSIGKRHAAPHRGGLRAFVDHDSTPLQKSRCATADPMSPAPRATTVRPTAASYSEDPRRCPRASGDALTLGGTASGIDMSHPLGHVLVTSPSSPALTTSPSTGQAAARGQGCQLQRMNWPEEAARHRLRSELHHSPAVATSALSTGGTPPAHGRVRGNPARGRTLLTEGSGRPPPVPLASAVCDGPVQPARRACGEIHVQAKAQNHG
jgi:hypothetical protein